MKSMKGKLLKKLKTIKTIGYPKPDRILQVSAADGYVPDSPPNSAIKAQNQSVLLQEETKKIIRRTVRDQEPEIIDVSELMKDLEDQEMEIDDDDINDKENIRPQSSAKNPVFNTENLESLSPLKQKNDSSVPKELRGGDTKAAPLAEINGSNFRRPNLDSGTLFDPNLLEAFEQAVMEVKAQEAERRAKIEEKIWQGIEEEPPLKARKIEETADPLLNFEEKCPPGGSDSVILYTTGLRGIRKTFEDCHSIRFLLENFRILFFERDISMHSEFREELWQIFGGKVVPPRLFIKGRYVGGAEEVLGLHEQGRLRPLLGGIPIDSSNGHCEGCAGVRFIMCFNCNGSRKIKPEDGGGGESVNCPQCNENGLLICPMCC
ncbi:uncharacterized protein [Coffea arabica]|uniref:Glutaredoxin domain-containing protein n=1 Tax=Coffea arabica TaxID=13443 RepID=A0A6P6VQ96_COFAR|nr:uncharacterized protein At3g28850-like [Coffea arabica]